jgi:hypothetical protein
LAFRAGFVWLRPAVERKLEAEPAVMVFKGACSKWNRFYTLSALKKGAVIKPKIKRVTQMMTEGKKGISPSYSTWFGRPVVLLVKVRQGRIPMLCSIVGESDADLRILLNAGWEMDVRKELILAIEEDSVAVNTRPN